MCVKNILIVDDEPLVADTAKLYFEQAGFHVVTANDGQAALALSRTEKVDAVITDFRMPRMNGLDLLAQMRQVRSSLPAIMVSGFTGDFQLGEDSRTKVFQKPARLEKLLQCIREMPCADRAD